MAVVAESGTMCEARIGFISEMVSDAARSASLPAEALEPWFVRAVTLSEAALDHVLRPEDAAVPERLLAAMRYACLGGGKRLRPALIFASAQAARPGSFPDDPAVVQVAAAIEMIHAHSLVHDDLPAMDDDDLRRGKPTVHRAFDEATAILCGSALLIRAFELLVDPVMPAALSVELVRCLTACIGWRGVIAGQMYDLDLEGSHSTGPHGRGPAPLSDAGRVGQIHDLKTALLIRAACVMGARAASADEHNVARLAVFGDQLGRAFQAVDDVLDVIGTSASLGKGTRKDVAAGRSTLPTALGLDEALSHGRILGERALETLADLGPEADALRLIVHMFVFRRLPH